MTDKQGDIALVPIERRRAWNDEPTCCRFIKDKHAKNVFGLDTFCAVDLCDFIYFAPHDHSDEWEYFCAYTCDYIGDRVKGEGVKQWLPPLEGCPVWEQTK